MPFPLSLLVFLGGLAMTITPGKVGELVKCYLLRDRAGVPVAASIPIVLMERVTDLVSVVFDGPVWAVSYYLPSCRRLLLLALAVVAAGLVRALDPPHGPRTEFAYSPAVAGGDTGSTPGNQGAVSPLADGSGIDPGTSCVGE